MKRKTTFILAITALALAALACAALTAQEEGAGEEVDPNAPTSTPSPEIIFGDDFSSPNWGTGTDADSSIEYVDNALQMIVHTKNWFVWSTPNAEEYRNVRLEVTALVNESDAGTTFGLMCDQQPVQDNFYYFAVKPTGEYAIAKATQGQSDIYFTSTKEGQWASSDLIAKDASSYSISADCGNGTLTLYVNGQQITTLSDTSYTSGSVALFAFSAEESPTTNISFDDFLIMKLP